MADVNLQRAQALGAQHHHSGCQVYEDWRQLVQDPEVDLLIVATTNDALAEVAGAFVDLGKPVLLEKPAGRNPAEIAELILRAERTGAQVKVGFNHRFHPALLKAREIIATHELGELMYIRGRYGHGGRIGYDREWRADPLVSGGANYWTRGYI